jgi:hypothetical protein
MPFADILQDRDLPVRSVGVYMHFKDIIFYAWRERICTERVNTFFFSDCRVMSA